MRPIAKISAWRLLISCGKTLSVNLSCPGAALCGAAVLVLRSIKENRYEEETCCVGIGSRHAHIVPGARAAAKRATAPDVFLCEQRRFRQRRRFRRSRGR